MLTYYYAPGSIAFAPHLLLEELGIEHALVRVLTGEEQHRRPEFLQINPLGRLPAVKLEDGRVLTETAAVLQYIAALKPEAGLVPSEPWQRARCHEWLSLIGTTIHPAYALVLRPDRVIAEPSTHDALRKESRARFMELLRHCETRVPQEGWLLGTELSVADAYLAVIVMWARFINVPLDELPRLKAWFGRVAARPAFRRTLQAEGLIDAAGKPTPPTRV
jgi:glutathione S-transferase